MPQGMVFLGCAPGCVIRNPGRLQVAYQKQKRTTTEGKHLVAGIFLAQLSMEER